MKHNTEFDSLKYREAVREFAIKQRISGNEELGNMKAAYKHIQNKLHISYSKAIKWGNQKCIDSGTIKPPSQAELEQLKNILGTFENGNQLHISLNEKCKENLISKELKAPLRIYFDELKNYPYLSKLLPYEPYSCFRMLLNSEWNFIVGFYDNFLKILASYSQDMNIEVYVLLCNFIKTRIEPFIPDVETFLNKKSINQTELVQIIRASFRVEVLEKINSWGIYL